VPSYREGDIKRHIIMKPQPPSMRIFDYARDGGQEKNKEGATTGRRGSSPGLRIRRGKGRRVDVSSIDLRAVYPR